MKKTDYGGDIRLLSALLCEACGAAGKWHELDIIIKKADNTASAVLSALLHDFITPFGRGDTADAVLALRRGVMAVPSELHRDAGVSAFLSDCGRLCHAIAVCASGLDRKKSSVGDFGLAEYTEVSGRMHERLKRLAYDREALNRLYDALISCYSSVFAMLTNSF